VLGFITGTIIAQRLVKRRGLDGVIGLGTLCLGGGGLLMLAATLAFGQQPGLLPSLSITLPMALYAAGVGLTMPQAQASAMMPFPERAGAASSLVGICQMTLSALVGLLVGWLLTGKTAAVPSALPLPVVIACIGVIALATFHLSHGIRKARA
jgi:MFS transporter, DHA1 family, multidrug resistance protein